MPRTAEVVYIGDASSIIRASQQAAAAAESSSGKIVTASAKVEAAQKRQIAAAQKSAEAFGKWGTVAAVAVVGASAKMAIDVEKATTAIANASGTNVAAAKRIEDAFRSTSGTAEFSAAKIGTAFASIAGELRTVEGRALDSAQAMKVMQAAMNLTDATGGQLNQTTEALGKVMLSFGLHANQAAEASDVLYAASKATGTPLESLVQTVDRMHGRLGALGPSLQETAGLMVEFAKQGIQGRQSLQTLNGVFSTLVNGGKNVAAMSKELGLRIFDARGQFVGLSSIIGQLQPKFAKLTQESQLQAAKALFGAGANKQLLDIIHQGPAAFDAATKATARHGAAAEAARKQHETLEAKLKITKAAVENLGASIGERLIPFLTKAANALNDGIKWLEKHTTAAKILAGVIVGVLGAAVVDFAVTKAVKFAASIKTMIDGATALAARLGLTGAAATTAAAEIDGAAATEAAAVTAADSEMAAANVAAGASFTAMAATAVTALGAIGVAVAAAVLAIKGLEAGIQAITGEKSSVTELLGGNQPGEAGKEGEAFSKLPKAAKEHQQKELVARGQNTYRHTAVEEAARRYGIDPAVLWGIYGNETAYGTNIATSSAGAMGAFQFIPETARSYQYPLTNNPNASQFKAQAEAAARYMHDLIRQNHGNVEAALQQYSGNTPGYARKARQNAKTYVYGTGTIPVSSTGKRVAVARGMAEEPYTNPFGGLGNYQFRKIDQGVDVGGQGNVQALGAGRIFKVTNNDPRWEGGTFIGEQLTTGPHKGQYVYYAMEGQSGGALVRQGQAVGKGQALGHMTRGGEFGFAFGPGNGGNKPLQEYLPGNAPGNGPTPQGKAFDAFLKSIGKTGSYLGGMAEAAGRAATAVTHLALSAVQAAKVGKLEGQAAEFRAQRGRLESHIETFGTELEVSQARRAARHESLATPQGASQAAMGNRETVGTRKAEADYMRKELAAVKKEGATFAKLRNQYLSFARHAHGNAKKEALKKAAVFGAKVEQAEKDAQALGGKLFAQETKIIDAEGAAALLPGEQQGADLSAYEAAVGKVDAEVRAGVKTEAEGKTAKEGVARGALTGAYGPLSEEGVLKVKGDLREFSQALQEATAAQEQHTQALKEATKTLAEFNEASTALAQVESGTALKALADFVSGQIAGTGYHPGVNTPGAGRAATY